MRERVLAADQGGRTAEVVSTHVSSWPPAYWALALGFVLLASLLRGEAARDALWIDEWISVWTVADSWQHVAPRAATGHAHPLYYWLAWIWTRGLGLPGAAIRVLSVVASLMTVWLIGHLVYRVTRNLWATAAVLALAAVDQNFVFYGSEARPYAVIQLLGLLQLAVSMRLLGCVSPAASWAPDWRLLGWSALNVALGLFHFTSILLLATELLVLLAILLLRPAFRPAARRLSVALLLSLILLFVLCGSSFQTTWNSRANWQSFVTLESFWQAHWFGLRAYLLPAVLALIGICCGERSRRSAAVAECSLPWNPGFARAWWFSIAVAGTMLLGVVSAQLVGMMPLAHYRYVIALSGMFPVLTGWALGRAPRVWGNVLGIFCLAGAGWYFLATCSHLSIGQWQVPLRYERWDEACGRIDRASGKNLPVVVFPNLIEDSQITEHLSGEARSYYLAPTLPLQVSSPLRPIFPADAGSIDPCTPDAVASFRSAGGGWLLIRADWGWNGRPPELVTAIAANVVAQLRRNGIAARWQIEPIPTSTVYLVRMTSVAASDSEPSPAEQGARRQTPNGGNVSSIDRE